MDTHMVEIFPERFLTSQKMISMQSYLSIKVNVCLDYLIVLDWDEVFLGKFGLDLSWACKS